MTGTINERDERGRIISKSLTSEEARLMRANVKGKAEKAKDAAEAILLEIGFTDEHPAPAIIKELAAIATSRRANSVGAISQLIKMARAGEDGAGVMHPPTKPGDVCELCGRVYKPAEHVAELRQIVETVGKAKTLYHSNAQAAIPTIDNVL